MKGLSAILLINNNLTYSQYVITKINPDSYLINRESGIVVMAYKFNVVSVCDRSF